MVKKIGVGVAMLVWMLAGQANTAIAKGEPPAVSAETVTGDDAPTCTPDTQTPKPQHIKKKHKHRHKNQQMDAAGCHQKSSE